MYSRVAFTGVRNGTPCQPSTTWGPETPRPRMRRPPESCWRVSAVMAVVPGVRADSWAMAVPSFSVVVAAATKASGVKASATQASPVQMESYPADSASWAMARRPSGSRGVP